jgi:SAM-dependent methyltransferase
VCGFEGAKVVAESNVDVAELGPLAYASRKPPELMHHQLLECPRCDTLYASPVPSRSDLRSAYVEAAYDSAEESGYAAATYAALARPLLPALPPGAAALDIGAGDGAFLLELDVLGFKDVVGVEPSRAPVAQAPPAARERIRVGEFDAHDFPDGAFGLVTCFQTLEHVPDPVELCRSARRLLAPGGVLLVVCHDRRAPLNRLLGKRSPIYDLEHLQLFSRRSLLWLLDGAGFRRVQARPVTNRYPLRYWLRLAPLPERVRSPAARALDRLALAGVAVPLRPGNLAVWGFNDEPNSR